MGQASRVPHPSRWNSVEPVVVVAFAAVADAVPRIASSSALESVQAFDRSVLCYLLTKEKNIQNVYCLSKE